MQRIPLSKVASQSASFTISGVYWTLKIYPAITHMCADITKNGVTLISGIRCFASTPLIPYDYLVGSDGNFLFDSDVDWSSFGTSPTCNLYYLTNAEMTSFNELIEAGDEDVAYNAAN